MVASQSPEQVAKAVQSALNGEVRGRFVRVLADGVRPGDSGEPWWFVPVAYQQDPRHAYEFFELFAVIEQRLLSDNRLDMLLVPHIIAPPPDVA